MKDPDQPALGPPISLQKNSKLEEQNPQFVTLVADMDGCSTRSMREQQRECRADTKMRFQSGWFRFKKRKNIHIMYLNSV